MKKLFTILFILMSLFIGGCSSNDAEENTNTPGGQPTSSISVTPTSLTFLAEGDSQSVIVSSSGIWALSGAVNWCKPSISSGRNGDAVTFTTDPNISGDERNVTYTFTCGDKTTKLVVTQKQNDALTVTTSKFEVGANGGDIRIEIKANISFDYEIAENCREWVSYVGTRAMTTSNLTFKIAANSDTKQRQGSIVIRSGNLSETISIYQAGGAPAIVVSQDKYTVSDKGETIKVEVNSNVDYTVEMPSVDWISENTSRAVSTHTHYYTIAPNETTDQRTARIIYTNEENSLQQVVTITQVQKDALVLLEKSSQFNSEGGTLSVGIQHNVDFDIEIGEDSRLWIQQITTRALETDYLNFTISPNSGYDNREGSITFRSKDGKTTQTHTVYQGQKNAIILSKNEINLSDEKQTFSIEINTNIDFEVTVSEAEWLHPIETRALASHTLNYSVDANETYDERFATIVVRNTQNEIEETVTIVQAQKDAIILGEDSYTISNEGGTLDLEVKSNIDYEISVVDDDWIHYTPTRALQNSTVHLVIDPNPDQLQTRIGSVEFIHDDIKQKITITQFAIDLSEDQIIYYTSSDNAALYPNSKDFGANIIANLYENGQGKLIFDKPVTKIGDKAYYYYYKTLTSITLPQTVTSIGTDAFRECSNLTSINLPENITSIGANAFYNCSNLTGVTLPKNLTTISEGMFYGCANLANIALPDNITTIDQYAFCRCTNLTGIDIPETVTTIGRDAFSRSGLTTLVIPDNVSVIDAYLCKYCKNLTSVHIGKSVELIMLDAFSHCENLISVSFSDNCLLKDIQFRAFYACKKLRSITIPDNVERIGSNILQECSSLEAVSGGKNLTKIPGDAFYGCNNLQEIDLPEITIVEQRAFTDCYRLKNINMPKLTQIDNQAFAGCTNANFVIGNISSCAADAFDGCYGNITLSGVSTTLQNSTFSKITILGADGASNIVADAFSGGACTSVIIGPNITIGDRAFSNCTALKNVQLPETTMTIAHGLFQNCKSLESIIIPNNVTSIGDQALYNCTSLSSIRIGSNIKSWGKQIFYGCSGTLYIDSNIISLPEKDGAFYGSKFLSLTLGPHVTEIGSYAFYGTGLRSIEIEGNITSIGLSAFENCSDLQSFKFPGSLTSIGNKAFKNCHALYSVDIPEIIGTIGEEAFYGCKNLSAISIKNISSIGDYAFANCSNLTTVELSDNITMIGVNPFRNCVNITAFEGKYASTDGRCLIVNNKLIACITKGLTEYTLPNGIRETGAYVLIGTDLKSLTIPDDVIYIRNYSFYGSELVRVDIGDNVLEIGEQAFCNNLSLKEVFIGVKVATIGYGAFYSNALSYVYCKPHNPPSIYNNPFNNFGSHENYTIFVPSAAYEQYKQADGWRGFASKIRGYSGPLIEP